jgi:hypothetical protein
MRNMVGGTSWFHYMLKFLVENGVFYPSDVLYFAMMMFYVCM